MRAGTALRHDLALEGGGVELAGSVLDGLGGGVPFARVQVTRVAPRDFTRLVVEADAEGHFALWVAPGPHVVNATADGYSELFQRVLTPSTPLTLTLLPAAQIAGRVLARDTREPAAGVQVRAIAVGTNAPAGKPGESDDEGRFVIDRLTPGMFELVASGREARGEGSELVELGLGEKRTGVIVEVTPAVTITGHVLRAGDAPCEHGYVRFDAGAATSPPGPGEPARTNAALPTVFAAIDDRGAVELRGLIEGTYSALVACAEHVLRDGPRTVRVTREGTEPPVWHVTPGLALRVRTVDPHGRPVPRAMLAVLGVGLVPPPFPYASDEQGVFESPHELRAGHYTVRPIGSLRAAPVEVELTPDVPLREVELRYEGVGSLVVDVHGQDQRPVDAISVYAEQVAEGEPARVVGVVYGVPVAPGRMRIGPLPSGHYRVRVDDGTNPPVAVGGESLQFAGGDQSLQVRLLRSASVGGRVENARGEPLASVWVTAKYIATVPARKSPWLRPTRALSDDEGAFELNGLVAEASYELRAELPGGDELVVRDARPGAPVLLRAHAPSQ